MPIFKGGAGTAFGKSEVWVPEVRDSGGLPSCSVLLPDRCIVYTSYIRTGLGYSATWRHRISTRSAREGEFESDLAGLHEGGIHTNTGRAKAKNDGIWI